MIDTTTKGVVETFIEKQLDKKRSE
jgi:hypothetical protein